MDAERAMTIACNAIIMWRQDAFYEYDHDEDWKKLAMIELDITEEEYKEIMRRG